MNNYFRITSYYPEANISFIVDSHEKFTSLADFSLYLLNKGCKIIQIGRAENFQDGNITKIHPATNSFFAPVLLVNLTVITALSPSTVNSTNNKEKRYDKKSQIPERPF